jgi:hypothetical protein
LEKRDVWLLSPLILVKGSWMFGYIC